MPYVSVKWGERTLSKEEKQDLGKSITDLLQKVMGKRPDVTAVLFEKVDLDSWIIGGGHVEGNTLSPVHVDIKITDGTNTPEEKSEMITKTDELLNRVLGCIPEASYVVIHELSAENWGYGGQTQEQRRVQTKSI